MENGSSNSEDDVSIIMVTSPCPSMPSLTLINAAFDSTSNLIGIETYIRHTYILMDGYKSTEETRFKKGRLGSSHQPLYEEYFEALHHHYGSRPHYSIVRSSEHLGFAMLVKMGLELCTTKFALILQHDRCFRRPYPHLSLVFSAFNENSNIRYVGFPTGSSYKHDLVLQSSYKLEYLSMQERISLSPSLSLQPLIFWFDSQHLAHVKRYLEIFSPHRSMDDGLRNLLTKTEISSMKLRRGDFIEDRFGQAQRNFFLRWQSESMPPESVCALFRWFGSYLSWELEDEQENAEYTPPKVLVSHLNGRSLDLEFLDSIATTYGLHKITNRQHRLLLSSMSNCDDDSPTIDTSTEFPGSFSALKQERRKHQAEQLQRLLKENGAVLQNSESLGEAMSLLCLGYPENDSEDC